MYLTGLGMNPDDCRRAGGVPRVYHARYDAAGRPLPGFETYGCDFPPAGGAKGSEIVISVPTTTQTEVSPQVSPQFIQQQQPEDSPVGVELRKDTETVTREPDSALIDLLRQVVPPPQNVYVPPAPATPQPFTASGEQAIESPGPFGIPMPFLLAAGVLGAALIYNRTKRGKRK